MKTKNTNKGITLIALVITIIVMLILVAVTITMAVNGGLFNYAGKAASQTNEAIKKEQELANLEANMTVDELIDKYTDSQDETPAETITFTIDGVEYTAEKGMDWATWISSSYYNFEPQLKVNENSGQVGYGAAMTSSYWSYHVGYAAATPFGVLSQAAMVGTDPIVADESYSVYEYDCGCGIY